MAGFFEAPLGTKVSPNKLAKVSGYKLNEVFRITILSKTVAIVKYHYHETIKSFYCFDGICCEKLGMPVVRYIFPVLVYDCDKEGNIRAGSNDWRVAPLVLGYKEYQNILLKDKISGDITSVDLLCTCTNEQYQNYSFDIAGQTNWKQMKEITDKIRDEMAYYKANIKKSFAKELTEEELIAALSLPQNPTYFPPSKSKPEIPVASTVVERLPEIEPPVKSPVELEPSQGDGFEELFR